VQPPQLPLSSLHSKLDPDSVEEKAKLALVTVVVVDGPLLIALSGAVVSGGGTEASIVQLRAAGVASTLPTASVARTES
jgi:hypothetical protein